MGHAQKRFLQDQTFGCRVASLFRNIAIVLAMALPTASLFAGDQSSCTAQYWQLTFSYDENLLALTQADPIEDMVKTPSTPGLSGAPVRVEYEADWIDYSGSVVFSSTLRLPIGGHANEEPGSPCRPEIPTEGAVVVRVQGPSADTSPATIRLKQTSVTGITGDFLQIPASFESRTHDLRLEEKSSVMIAQEAYPSTKIWGSGPDENRFVIVVLAEGYTAAQHAAGDFEDDVNRAVLSHLITKAPWDELNQTMNMYRIDVESNESGVDNEPCGTEFDTYFNAEAVECGFRLNLASGGALLAFAAADEAVGVGKWDFCIMLINDDTYRAIGHHPTLLTSDNVWATAGVIVHEFGHTGFTLGDEYGAILENPCFPPPEVGYPNVCATYELETLPWAHWVEPSTPLPTPDMGIYDFTVGAFRGAHYCDNANFRPMRDCLMRYDDVNDPFCPPCVEQHWVVIMDRISMLDDIWPPNGSSVSLGYGDRLFEADTLAIDYLTFQWTLAGTPIPGETGPNLNLTRAMMDSLGIDSTSLQLTVDIITDQVRKDIPEETFSWTVVTCSGTEDTDSDGIVNECDNCPEIANAGQEDTDFDLVGDSCDDCIDSDNDGYGDPGYGNTCPDDNCPDTYNPDQVDLDGDGVGDLCQAPRVFALDTIGTSCTRLVVTNNGRYGYVGFGGVNMDYSWSGDCESSAISYLVEGSSVLSYVNESTDDTVAANTWYMATGFDLARGRKPTLSTQSTEHYNVYETGTMVTEDSAFCLENTWWGPTDPGHCNYLIQRQKVYRQNDDTISLFCIGDVIDWDLPTTTADRGGYDIDYNLLYQQSTGAGCQDNEGRFGGLAFLGFQHSAQADMVKDVHGGYVDQNSIWLWPALGLVPDEALTNMLRPGLTATAVTDDIHMLMSYAANVSMDSQDTVYVWSVTMSTLDGTVDDLRAIVDSAKVWTSEHFGLDFGCCGQYSSGFTGNANCSEDGKLTLSDITRLIDHVYVSKSELCCDANGNVNGSTDLKVTLSDITRLIDHVYISKSATEPCL